MYSHWFELFRWKRNIRKSTYRNFSRSKHPFSIAARSACCSGDNFLSELCVKNHPGATSAEHRTGPEHHPWRSRGFFFNDFIGIFSQHDRIRFCIIEIYPPDDHFHLRNLSGDFACTDVAVHQPMGDLHEPDVGGHISRPVPSIGDGKSDRDFWFRALGQGVCRSWNGADFEFFNGTTFSGVFFKLVFLAHYSHFDGFDRHYGGNCFWAFRPGR